MDVSGETADLLIREGVQATEGALKLTGACLKNVTALLIAISRQDHKVVGKTSSKRLARDPAPAEVVQIRKEDIPRFKKLAKRYGILYFFVHKKGNEHGMTNIVSNQNYAAQLNAAMEELTRKERANNVKKKDFFSKYSAEAQAVLSILLDKYMNQGITEVEDIKVLSLADFAEFGKPAKIVKLFGGKAQYEAAIKELEANIYELEVS